LTAEAAAVCTGVVRIYWTPSGEVHALKGIDAEFSRGALTALVGPSGSGKSSLLRILAAIDRPTAGSVLLGGEETAGLPPRRLRALRRRAIGYVFQRPSDNLVPHLTVAEHLEVAGGLRGGGETGLTELVELLGIGGRAGHLPSQLSGGEQQRVAFAQAAVGGPRLIVADEPTAELDSRTAGSLLDGVAALAHTGAAVVVATHDPQVVSRADRVLALRHGALEAETRADRRLSVIDESGRIQLPPEMLALFPDRRAVISEEDGEVRITPP